MIVIIIATKIENWLIYSNEIECLRQAFLERKDSIIDLLFYYN